MSLPGRPLELALSCAARHYRARGRQVFLDKQQVRRTYAGQHAARAPIDFTGGCDGRAIAIEAKMTAGDEFPLERKYAPQRTSMSERLADGAECSLVVEFVDVGEIYLAEWSVVETFQRAAWRRSLTLDWFRAVGLLVPQLHTGDERKRCALWLDAAQHPAWALATKHVLDDCAGKPTFPIDGDLERDAKLDARRTPKQLALHERLASRPAPGTPEYREYMQQLVAEGCERQRGATKGRARFRGRGGQR